MSHCKWVITIHCSFTNNETNSNSDKGSWQFGTIFALVAILTYDYSTQWLHILAERNNDMCGVIAIILCCRADWEKVNHEGGPWSAISLGVVIVIIKFSLLALCPISHKKSSFGFGNPLGKNRWISIIRGPIIMNFERSLGQNQYSWWPLPYRIYEWLTQNWYHWHCFHPLNLITSLVFVMSVEISKTFIAYIGNEYLYGLLWFFTVTETWEL